MSSSPFVKEREGNQPSGMDQLQRPTPQMVEHLRAILIMGMTGAGKSSFISHLTKESVEVGHTLESHTSEVRTYLCELDGQAVHLIDTPGFDDTSRTSMELLTHLVDRLCMLRMGGHEIAGAIYIHRITDPRMGGSAVKSLRIFKLLCGRGAFPNVALVTNMWNKLPSHEEGDRREADLQENPEFWGDMCANGSFTLRHCEDSELSAREVLRTVLGRCSNTNLRIQQEMLEERKTLKETEVGRFVEADMREMREKYENEIGELRELLEEATKDNDAEATTELEEQSRAPKARLIEIMRQQDALSMAFHRHSIPTNDGRASAFHQPQVSTSRLLPCRDTSANDALPSSASLEPQNMDPTHPSSEPSSVGKLSYLGKYGKELKENEEMQRQYHELSVEIMEQKRRYEREALEREVEAHREETKERVTHNDEKLSYGKIIKSMKKSVSVIFFIGL